MKVDQVLRLVTVVSSYIEVNDLLRSVMAIREELSELLEDSYRQVRRGRPTLPIEEAHIRFYVEYNFSVMQIADMFGCHSAVHCALGCTTRKYERRCVALSTL